MSTLQFAELTGTKHHNVLAKARKLLEDLEILTTDFSVTRIDLRGKEQTMLELNKDLSLTLAGQYEPKIAYHVAQSFNATPQPAAPKLTPLEIAHNALLTTSQALSDEIAERQKVEKMLEVAKVVELAGCSSDNDISVDEFCKIITSSLENTNLGRTKCYIIFRAIGLVETQSTRPTQRGMTVYLDYRKHEFGYSTRVIKAKGSNLIKLMIRTLRNKPNLNSALGYPLGDF